MALPNDTADESKPSIDREIIAVDGLSFTYDGGKTQALEDINLSLQAGQITSFIGPSGCGKTTLIRCFNRMNDLIPNAQVSAGQITVMGQDVHDPSVDPIELRKQVGMVFQQYNPFPKSVFENIAFGLRLQGIKDKQELAEMVEASLHRAALWDEVKDRMDANALSLSGGQQQRLCIARAIAVKPKILLMDEPCSALDPIATARIEELIFELKSEFTIIIVTHSMQQAARVSDETAFFYLGRLIEFDKTATIFGRPSKKETEDYITGRFG